MDFTQRGDELVLWNERLAGYRDTLGLVHPFNRCLITPLNRGAKKPHRLVSSGACRTNPECLRVSNETVRQV